MTRNGKIARLPRPIREQINLRLQNGERGDRIVQWLNALPEAAAVMAAEFGGEPVIESNLTRWKNGGYRDWQAEQQTCAAIQSVIRGPDALQDKIPNGFAQRMNLLLTAAMASQFVQAQRTATAAQQSKTFGEWLNRYVRMRRTDFQGLRLAIERERLDLQHRKSKANS